MYILCIIMYRGVMSLHVYCCTRRCYLSMVREKVGEKGIIFFRLMRGYGAYIFEKLSKTLFFENICVYHKMVIFFQKMLKNVHLKLRKLCFDT